MTFTSVTDMYFVQTALTNVMKFTPARYFNVSTTWIDFSVSSIGNSIPVQPVRFQDSDGVSFNNTFIFNDGSATQPLDCGINGALILNDNVVINGNLTIRGYLYHSDNYQQCNMVPSDRRVKRDIAPAHTERLYERITKMPLKTFRYTEEYLASHGRPSHLSNTTYVGVIAQEVAKDFEYAVSKGRATVGAMHLPDMHHIHPELLYGEVVGALQHMRHLHEKLAERINRMEQRASRLASEAIKEGSSVMRATAETGKKAIFEMGKQAERGQKAVYSAEDHIQKAISYLHGRLERLERAIVDR